jgi:3-methyl-2-oxobutanoate hydroxymethyltransferase
VREKVTVPAIGARKKGPKLTMVTAYDTPMAVIVDEAGVDMILVGDSLATTVLGYDDTLHATLDVMVHHAAAVMRARPSALVVADMPWLSYHASLEATVQNAGRLIREGGASAVKLEGGRKRVAAVRALVDAEIPVMGHLGLTPQSVLAMGGYRVQGKEIESAQGLIADAHALQDAGVFALVLEGIPDQVAAAITREVDIPTIGIGAGPYCDGQVLVFHDVLGFQHGHLPKFVRQYAHLADDAIAALKQYCSDVQDERFPAEKETYHTNAEVARALHGQEASQPQHEPV